MTVFLLALSVTLLAGALVLWALGRHETAVISCVSLAMICGAFAFYAREAS